MSMCLFLVVVGAPVALRMVDRAHHAAVAVHQVH